MVEVIWRTNLTTARYDSQEYFRSLRQDVLRKTPQRLSSLIARPHPQQHFILDHVDMKERCSRMKHRHSDNHVCNELGQALTLCMNSSSPTFGKCQRLNNGNAGAKRLVMPRSTMMSNSRSSSRCVITANKWRKPRSDHDNLRSPATRQKQPSSDQKGERKSGHQLN